MRKLRIGVIDLVTNGPTRALYARVMYANLASIMPQVIAVWCEEEGHDVKFICYTGLENLVEKLPDQVDLVFIGAFTEAGQLAYALSNLFRSKGAVTVLGGPHARCYPEDARQYFDFVVGFTDKKVIRDVLQDCSQHRPLGVWLEAKQQPAILPGVRERWKFIEPTLQKAPLIKIVPMLGSLGCPYTCSFCIDSVVPYQPLELDVIKEDLRFLLGKFRRPRIGWHDPNFGVQFNNTMDAIEETVPPNSVDFIAESSLSLLSEPHLRRLKQNGFKGILPGIESWYVLGNKSRTGKLKGIDKVMNVLRTVSSSGFGRTRYYGEVRRQLEIDRQFRHFYERETSQLPRFYVDRICRGLGPLWDWLPEGALCHDPNAYLRSEIGQSVNALSKSAGQP